MATLSWDLVGGNPAPGDRAVYRELSHDLAATAQSADSALRRLDHFNRSCDESVWRGEAADAFRGKIRELPPKLVKLHRSYDSASRSMAGYGAVLDDLQPQARNLLERAYEAHREELVQKANRDRARAQAPDSGLLSFLSTPTTPFDRAVEDAQDRQREIKRQINHLRDERKGAEHKAVAGFERAQDQGMKPDSGFKKLVHGADKWVNKHADVLRKISGALKIVSAVAGVLSFIPVLNFITAPIAFATGGAALAIDGTLVATGNGNWKAFAVDAALMALPGVGKLVGKGLRSGAPQLMGRVEGAISGSRAMTAVNRVGASKAGRILAAPGRGLNRVNDVIAAGLGRTPVGRGIVNASERAGGRAERLFPSGGGSPKDLRAAESTSLPSAPRRGAETSGAMDLPWPVPNSPGTSGAVDLPWPVVNSPVVRMAPPGGGPTHVVQDRWRRVDRDAVRESKATRTDANGAEHTPAQVVTAPRDHLGRTQGALGSLDETDALLGGSIARRSIKPTGWGGGGFQGHARGHLIARMLGGSGLDRRNLVTLNSTANRAMETFEITVRKLLVAGERVDYRVTPIYLGNNLKPIRIEIDAWTSAGTPLRVVLDNA